MSLPVSLQTTPESDLIWCFDPDAVGETLRGGRAGAGESLKNNNGRPFDGLPTVERGSELVVLPVANLIVRIAARLQRVEDLGLKAWPPAHEVHPRDEVIHLDKWRADAGRNPRSQGALTGALRTINTDTAYAIVCRALHDLGDHVVKAKYRHATTIAVEASAHCRGERPWCVSSSRACSMSRVPIPWFWNLGSQTSRRSSGSLAPCVTSRPAGRPTSPSSNTPARSLKTAGTICSSAPRTTLTSTGATACSSLTRMPWPTPTGG